MMFQLDRRHQPVSLAPNLRSRALAVADDLTWTASHQRELKADENLRKEWWLYPLVLVALALCQQLAIKYGADTALFPLFYVGLFGSFIHLFRRRLCLVVARAIRAAFSPSTSLTVLRTPPPASPGFTSWDVLPEKAPPRLNT